MLYYEYFLHRTNLICVILMWQWSIGGDSAIVSQGEVVWQLHNHCSNSLLQTYLGHINARGHNDNRCLTDFTVRPNIFGAFHLQHAQSRKFICFNKRRRITIRLMGDSIRCMFHERINDAGYTEIESAWQKGLFLGFNRKGRFQDPSTRNIKRKCFLWTRFQRYVPNSELCEQRRRKVSPAPPQVSEKTLRDMMRNSLLNQVRATLD